VGFLVIKYQNKEKESTFNLRRIDFGARTYNASIGRFDRVDPLAEKRVWLTPYNFVKNNPLNRIDPNGTLDEPCCGDDPSDDPFLFAKLAVTAFYDTKHAIYNTALRAFGSDLRAGYKVENGNEVFETEFTKKPVDNSFKGVVKETVSAVADVVSIIPGGSTEGKLLAQTSKSQSSRAVKEAVNSSISPNVQKVLNTISDLKKAGGEVKVNALKAVDKQEVNMTFKNTDGSKLDFRIETHRLSPSVGGNGVTPQRHLNATVTNSNGNVVTMKHINKGHKILE
jgi:RHS repeat-associated protein